MPLTSLEIDVYLLLPCTEYIVHITTMYIEAGKLW